MMSGNDGFKIFLAAIVTVLCLLAIIWIWLPEVFNGILEIVALT